jgi:hypothetical protein
MYKKIDIKSIGFCRFAGSFLMLTGSGTKGAEGNPLKLARYRRGPSVRHGVKGHKNRTPHLWVSCYKGF